MGDGVINLNTGITIQKIFGDTLTPEQLQKVEEAAKDGFTEDELAALELDGIDVGEIRKNSTAAGAADAKATKTDADVPARAQEIADKYCKDLEKPTGDLYSANNPQLKALSTAMADGLLKDLRAEGFSKMQIVDIINQAFPNIGVGRSGNGGYSVPVGHDEESKKIYNTLQSQLYNVTAGSKGDIPKETLQKLAKLNKQIRSNNYELQSLEIKIRSLETEIQERIDDAIDKSAKIGDKQKTNSKEVVSRCLSDYAHSEGKMTYEEFQQNVRAGLKDEANDAQGELAIVVLDIIHTERKMGLLGSLLDSMKSLNDMNADLAGQVKDVQSEIDTISDEDLNADSTDPDCSRCDPIGFTTADGTRYDLFVDKDGDEKLSNEHEFLGAENGLDELRAFDTADASGKGDGVITGEELKKVDGLKVVITHPDGTQEVKDATEVFKDDDKLDLNTFNEINQTMSNNNILQGTFDVTFGDEFLDDGGYQTLDTLDYLDANYDFSDADKKIGRFALEETQGEAVKDFSAEYDGHVQKLAEERERIKTAWVNLFGQGQEIDDMRRDVGISAERDAKTIRDNFEAADAEKAHLIRKEEEEIPDEEGVGDGETPVVPNEEPEGEGVPVDGDGDTELPVDPDKIDPEEE